METSMFKRSFHSTHLYLTKMLKSLDLFLSLANGDDDPNDVIEQAVTLHIKSLDHSRSKV